MRSSFLPRIRIISIFLFLFVLIILSRLYFIQIVHGEEYSERADRQYLKPAGSLFDRGSIYFEDKDGTLISAATLKNGYTLSINNKLLKDPVKAHSAIEKIIDIDDESFFFKAGKKDDPYEEILRKMGEEDAVAIKNLEIKGIDVIKEKWRFYPGFNVGSRMLGFVGFQGNEYAGRYGLERQYEDILKRDGDRKDINFFAEVFSNLSQNFKKDSLRTKGDIVTTIEPSVQTFFQTIINGVQKNGILN